MQPTWKTYSWNSNMRVLAGITSVWSETKRPASVNWIYIIERAWWEEIFRTSDKPLLALALNPVGSHTRWFMSCIALFQCLKLFLKTGISSEWHVNRSERLWRIRDRYNTSWWWCWCTQVQTKLSSMKTAATMTNLALNLSKSCLRE